MPSSVRVIAGLHSRSDLSSSQTSYVTSLITHERYKVDSATYSNDLAILYLTEGFDGNSNVTAASLPVDNSNDYHGNGIAAVGWGRVSCSNLIPDIAQLVNGAVLSSANASAQFVGVNGASIWDNQLIYLDDLQSAILANGAQGGPVFADDGMGGAVLVGIQSWEMVSMSGCPLPSYPTVATRVSAYLDWINAHL
jgi:secreted trypsin-like serine protease